MVASPNLPRTKTSWTLRVAAGSAMILTVVRSRPRPARLIVAATFKFCGKQRTACAAVPSNITVASRIVSRSIPPPQKKGRRGGPRWGGGGELEIYRPPGSGPQPSRAPKGLWREEERQPRLPSSPPRPGGGGSPGGQPLADRVPDPRTRRADDGGAFSGGADYGGRHSRFPIRTPRFLAPLLPPQMYTVCRKLII